jgi:hypothetical protein
MRSHEVAKILLENPSITFTNCGSRPQPKSNRRVGVLVFEQLLGVI